MTAWLVGISCGTAWGLTAAVRADPTAAPASEEVMVRPAPAGLRDHACCRAASGGAGASGRKVEVLRRATFLLVILVLVFAVSLLAFRRWSRHYRARLLREPHGATESDDVWAMHRLPDSHDDSDDHGIEALGEDDARADDDIADDEDESR
jgi:hypothetical protein